MFYEAVKGASKIRCDSETAQRPSSSSNVKLLGSHDAVIVFGSGKKLGI